MKENLIAWEKILENRKPFQFQSQKKLKEPVKLEKKLQKLYLTNYNLLIAQDLCQAHYQILLIILLGELVKLNVNMGIIIKNVKRVELNRKIVSAASNTQMLQMI